MPPCQGGGHGFEPRLPLHYHLKPLFFLNRRYPLKIPQTPLLRSSFTFTFKSQFAPDSLPERVSGKSWQSQTIPPSFRNTDRDYVLFTPGQIHPTRKAFFYVTKNTSLSAKSKEGGSVLRHERLLNNRLFWDQKGYRSFASRRMTIQINFFQQLAISPLTHV